MNNERYCFGSSLREMLLSGKDEKTALRVKFEEKLLQACGIFARHSEFAYHCIFIEVDAQTLLDDRCFQASGGEGVFYPTDSMKTAIFSCFYEAIAECGLSPVTIDDKGTVPSVIIQNFQNIAASIFLNLNVAEIDRALKQAFPYRGVTLRFSRSSESSHYILIFTNEAAKKHADKTGITHKIIGFVLEWCKEKDVFGIFDGYEMRPRITTKEEILRTGQAMGIARENPDFTGL